MTTGSLLFGLAPSPETERVRYTILSETPPQVTPPPGGCKGWGKTQCPWQTFCRGVRGRLLCEAELVVEFESGEVIRM